jgi:hypothetical protein
MPSRILFLLLLPVLLYAVCSFARPAVLEPSPVPIVFVSRNPLPAPSPGDVPGIGPRWRTARTGGRLLLLTTRGTVVTLVGPGRLYDVADPCVSWDGTRVVFAGVERADSNWRIFEMRIDGEGFRSITRSDRQLDLAQFGAAAGLFDRYDDFDPCYLPDGRIVFASTRYPSMASQGRLRTSNLFLVNADGSGMRRITTERNGAEEPCVDPQTGRLVYSRWWMNLDRPSNMTRAGLSRDAHTALTADIGNLWQAVTIRPDGDELRLFAGAPRTRAGVHAYKPMVMTDGRLLTTFTSDFSLDATTGGTAIRLFRRGPGTPQQIIGSGTETPPFALEPAEFTPGTLLFCYSGDGEDYGIYRCSLNGRSLKRIVDYPGTLEMDPQPVRKRRLPPVLEDAYRHAPAALPPTEDPQTQAGDDFFRFDCMNIFTNAGIDVPVADAPRITRNARIRFFMNVQRQHADPPDPTILLKEAEVRYNGGVHQHDAPAEVSLFEQIVDSAGRVLETTDGKFAHVTGFNFERQGAGTKCIGCHAGHSMMDVPMNGTEAEWFNLAPSALPTASSVYTAADGEAFTAGRLIDRQARTGGERVVWIAGEGAGARVRLQWAMPVEVRSVVLYGLPRGVRKSTVGLQNCRITLFVGGEEVRVLSSTGAISERGTRIDLPPTAMDALEVHLTRSTGTVDGRRLTGLAEIEVIGRIPKPDAGLIPQR